MLVDVSETLAPNSFVKPRGSMAKNVPAVPVSTVTMGLADTSAAVADAMFVKAACPSVGVRNLVRVKTEAVFCG